MSKKKNHVPYRTINEAMNAATSAGLPVTAAVNDVAKKLAISTSTVYSAIRHSRSVEGSQKVPSGPVNRRPPSAVVIEMQLTNLPSAEVKLRNGGGNLKGTLFLSDVGLQYLRANQKTPAGRAISWEMLDRIMQLGLS